VDAPTKITNTRDTEARPILMLGAIVLIAAGASASGTGIGHP
jgi:hypothetical protein